MLYEWRVYEIVPGRKKDVHERFANHALKNFKKHGIEVIGFWESSIGGTSNTLYYMLAFRDLAHMEQAWKEFEADPEWQAAAAASEKNGILVAKLTNIVLTPTYYSPAK
jgi:NIPSNAP